LGTAQPLELILQQVHALIESPEVLVTEQLVVDEVELTSSVVVRIVVSGTREVEPFRVTEFADNQ
jgi:hypothetical protein